jgi:hypothetical protein
MSRKVFISYSHRLDQEAADRFANFFADQRDVFIDRSVRADLGDLNAETIKNKIRPLIVQSSVTVVLIGQDTGGRSWVDWEIYNSLRKRYGNERNGLLGIYIPNKRHWIPSRLQKNEHMGLITTWPREYRTLACAIEIAYKARNNTPNLSDPLRKRNNNRQSW